MQGLACRVACCQEPWCLRGGLADCDECRNTIYQGRNSTSFIVVELEPPSSFIVTASGRPTLGETHMSMITFSFSRHTPRRPLTRAYWHVDSTLNELVLPFRVVVQYDPTSHWWPMNRKPHAGLNSAITAGPSDTSCIIGMPSFGEIITDEP